MNQSEQKPGWRKYPGDPNKEPSDPNKKEIPDNPEQDPGKYEPVRKPNEIPVPEREEEPEPAAAP